MDFLRNQKKDQERLQHKDKVGIDQKVLDQTQEKVDNQGHLDSSYSLQAYNLDYLDIVYSQQVCNREHQDFVYNLQAYNWDYLGSFYSQQVCN
jgi:DUF2075 family protein